MNLTALGQEVKIGPSGLSGDLSIPENAGGIVVFAHGSGSSRFSPRNRFVAESLRQAGFATLLLDLLTEVEERIDLDTASFRFDIELLVRRLLEATGWIQREPTTHALPIGYFGASTGAGAAVAAAAQRPARIRAVVSRGGRPDLAGPALSQVEAPTLLIVGGNDPDVIDLNRQALAVLPCEKRLDIVPGATHLFEEPGALDKVAAMAGAWFEEHLK